MQKEKQQRASEESSNWNTKKWSRQGDGTHETDFLSFKLNTRSKIPPS